MTKLIASIIVATKNRPDRIGMMLDALLMQKISDAFEIIICNDGSTDNTKEIIEGYAKKFKKITVINLPKSKGPATARNKGIFKAKGKYIVIMDDDCVAGNNWLKDLLNPFKTDKKLGIVSSFGPFGGTSTAYLTEIVKKEKGFDEAFPAQYREDSDLVFRIEDGGFKTLFLQDGTAKFQHLHRQPQGFINKLIYGWKRIFIHDVDPLIYKKHPERVKKMLDVKLGFIRNPLEDFKVATGMWKGSKVSELGSPQGVTLIKNKSPLHFLIIILLGLSYVLLVKMARLSGSIKYGKLLI